MATTKNTRKSSRKIKAFAKSEVQAQLKRVSLPKSERPKGGIGLTLEECNQALAALNKGKSEYTVPTRRGSRGQVTIKVVPTKAQARRLTTTRR